MPDERGDPRLSAFLFGFLIGALLAGGVAGGYFVFLERDREVHAQAALAMALAEQDNAMHAWTHENARKLRAEARQARAEQALRALEGR